MSFSLKIKRRLAPIVIAISFALLISGCAPKVAIEKPLSDLATYENQQLDWSTCYDEFDCAELLVPIDYADLTVGSFEIALLRYKAKDQKNRIGSLVINPGGPGGSGVDYAYNAEYFFDPDVLDRYDIVGFDPRGVNRSAPIKCLNDEETDAAYAADAKLDNDAELTQALADAKDFIDKCQSANEYLSHYSTAESARDMDILRAALGDAKLNYLGKSYGTYLGTLYAQFFPNKVGRMVLDGAIDPNISILAQNISQAKGFDDALAAFIADCSKEDDCPLPKDKTEATAKITSIFTASATTPFPRKFKVKDDNRDATEAMIVLGTLSALYDDVDGWPKLRTAISEGLKGYGDSFLDLVDQYSDRSPDGTYLANELDSGVIIDCLDWPDTRTIEETKSDAKQFTDAAPIFGPYLAYTNIACKYLAPMVKDKLTRKTNKITSIKTAPILVIGTTGDPATPYKWAVGLHKIFTTSTLITLNGDGHLGQGRGGACVDDAVDAYLLEGKSPKKNLKCAL